MNTMQAITQTRYLADFDLDQQVGANEPVAIRQLRRRAIERFDVLGFPTIRHEDWRNTSVSAIAKTPFEIASGEPDLIAGALHIYHGAIRLVFVNGRFAPGLSDTGELPLGSTIGSLAEALKQTPELVEPHWGRYARFDEHSFAALNTAFGRDGAFIHLPRGVVVERPIHLLFLASVGEQPGVSYPRNLIVAGENSQVTIIENYIAATEGVYFTCPLTEVVVGAGAVIDHYKLQCESPDAFHISTTQVQMERASRFASLSISVGAALARNDVNAVLDAEGIECTLNGLYMVKDGQHVDNHLRVDHAKPHCASHQVYKGILDGKSRAVFNGNIHVHPDAQKTDAKQTNRNLLLSREALVHTNPQLEIFANDVKCSHGSTVGQMDSEALFYLRSRGLSAADARGLLTYAFASDMFEQIKVKALRTELEEFLFTWLPDNTVRHPYEIDG